MTTAKYTPGPWLARTTYFGANGIGTPCISHGDTASVMCWLNLSGAYNGNEEFDRAQADARLIAAAPDLLEALKISLSDHERIIRYKTEQNEYIRPELLAAAESARAAIAKAEGAK